MNRGGSSEHGAPRGKDTITGSYSGLFGDTSTRIDDNFFLEVDDGEAPDLVTLSALRFLLELLAGVGAISTTAFYCPLHYVAEKF